MALSRVLTLLVVVDEAHADAAIETANDASRQHPCRIIVVIAGSNLNRVEVVEIEATLPHARTADLEIELSRSGGSTKSK